MTYTADPKSYMREYMKERYHRRREQAVRLLGGKCAWCGTTESLEVDHIDPALKLMTVTRMYSVSEAKFLAELVKCQLLCNSHHIEKSRAERSVAHGEGASGKRNCSCIPCKTRKREYMQQWHKQHQSGGAGRAVQSRRPAGEASPAEFEPRHHPEPRRPAG